MKVCFSKTATKTLSAAAANGLKRRSVCIHSTSNQASKLSCHQIDQGQNQDEMICQLNDDTILEEKPLSKPCVYIAYSMNDVVVDTLETFCESEPYDEQCRMFDL